MTFEDRLVLSLAAAMLAAAVCGWIGWGPGLGVAVVVSAILAIAVGWGQTLRGAPALVLGATAAALSAVVLAIFVLDDPGGEGAQWFGLPRATALLVYVVWPLGLVPGGLYVWRFRRGVLPEDRLRTFLSRYSGRAAADRRPSPSR